MRKVIAGNWKMHLGPAEASLFLHKLSEKIGDHHDVEVVICPPFIDLYPLSRELDKAKFKLGAQNLHDADEGAFTGEISGAMLKDMVTHVIVGHSERRQIFGETDTQIAKKVAAALRNGLSPILCVGETLDDRQHDLSTKVVIDQLEANLANVTAEEIGKIAIAYEPIWAIGTGDFAKPDQISPVVAAIRGTVQDLYGTEAADQVAILYGGSVIPDNAKAYLTMQHVDGLLVGGASLKADDFSQIVVAATHVAGGVA
jgi:triosephosphate isomerase